MGFVKNQLVRLSGKEGTFHDDFGDWREKFYYVESKTPVSSKIQNMRTGEFIFVDNKRLTPVED